MAMHLNDENFNQEISQGITLVDFYADWCGPCRMMEPIIEELAQEMEGKAKVVKVDIEEAQKTAAQLNVTSIPTMILFNKGQEIQRMVGVRDKETLVDVISGAIH